MFEIAKLKVERENPMELMADLLFKIQRDWKEDNDYTEYVFHGTDTKGFSRKNINSLYRFFKPDKLYIYNDKATSLADMTLIGFVFRKDNLPEFSKFSQCVRPVEPEIATEGNWGEPVEFPQSKWDDEDQRDMK